MSKPAKETDDTPRRAVSYRLPERLLAQLDVLALRNRRRLTTEVELALEAHLKKAKLWPPPAGDDD